MKQGSNESLRRGSPAASRSSAGSAIINSFSRNSGQSDVESLTSTSQVPDSEIEGSLLSANATSGYEEADEEADEEFDKSERGEPVNPKNGRRWRLGANRKELQLPANLVKYAEVYIAGCWASGCNGLNAVFPEGHATMFKKIISDAWAEAHTDQEEPVFFEMGVAGLNRVKSLSILSYI